MPSDAPPPLSVGFVSLGCAKNLVDSQVMAGHLLEHNLRLAPSPDAADVIVVNTCAFIDAAREESIDAILSACSLKGRGRCRAVLVAGCMPQRYREELRESLPEVDAFIGLDELESIADVVHRVVRGEGRLLRVSEHSAKLYEPPASSVVFTGGPYAYLKIAEGCNHRCAFCAIPGIRGRYRSRPIAGVVAEAERLLAAGYRELDVISQDVMAYGRDRRDGSSLTALLQALGRIGGDFWIRLLYGYPTGVTPALLETMASIPQVCHYLDVPIQHCDPVVLRRMQRAGTIRAVHHMAAAARAAMPDITLRTTCLVGFPGETAARFEALVRFAEETRFDHLGAFVFSPEENTAAYRMTGRPSRAVAEKRRERLLLAQQAIVAAQAAARKGQPVRVLLERPAANGKTWEARSARQAPEVDGLTRVKGVPASARAGDFLDARYTGVRGYDLLADAARMPRRR